MRDEARRAEDESRAEFERQSALTPDEERSRTRGPSEYHMDPLQQDVFTRALDALNAAGVPYVVAGAHAIYAYTGAFRPTKDLDVFCEPRNVLAALEALERAGFRCHLEARHWLAKAVDGGPEGTFVDVIYGTGNGLFRIDPGWYRDSREGTLAGVPVRYAPPEELIWHRLFISERHRFDGADILHLILKQAARLDWRRLLERTGEHWPLLLAYLTFFGYVYPQHASFIPDWVLADLVGRLGDLTRPRPGETPTTRGTFISLFSFDVDTNEWGLRDLRRERIAEALQDPRLAPILASRFDRAPAPRPQPPKEELRGS